MTIEKNETPSERVQRAGLTVDQLREIVAGQSRPEFIERARATGLSMNELRDIIHQSSDTNSGSGSVATHVHGISAATQAGGSATQG
jgi:hypothetical protein